MIIGNLVRDPEMRYTPSGRPVTSFSVATNRSWTPVGGTTQEATEYHNVVTWAKLAEICNQFLKKGAKVYVAGRLQTHNWEDLQKVKHYRTEIIADDVIFLGGTRMGEGPIPAANMPASNDASSEGPALESTSTPPVDNRPTGAEDVDLGDGSPMPF